MQRSSDSIAKLATALAKAQIELVNLEKSLVGTIQSGSPGAERAFRYASLASGLEHRAQDLRGAANSLLAGILAVNSPKFGFGLPIAAPIHSATSMTW